MNRISKRAFLALLLAVLFAVPAGVIFVVPSGDHRLL